jgi:hypothetical protein
MTERARRPNRQEVHSHAPDVDPLAFEPKFEETLRQMTPNEEELGNFNLDSDMSIDLFNLHQEWADHGRKALKYIKESRKASTAWSLAEERVKTIRSQLIKEAGIAKITSSDQREAYYRLHPRYIQAKREAIEAEQYASYLINIVIEMRGRKQALENEVTLQGREYYVDPHLPKTFTSVEGAALGNAKEARTEENIRRRTNRQ